MFRQLDALGNHLDDSRSHYIDRENFGVGFRGWHLYIMG